MTDQSFKETITLRRPLAQINVGTLDYQEAVNAGVTITKSNVTVSKVASTLDFFTGKTSNPVDVTFAVHTTPMLSLPQGDNTLTVYYGTEKEKEYDYLSLNYILVADDSATGFDKSLVDFKVDFYEEGNSNPVNDPIEIPNVPVRRNYRTNIVGDAVLTQEFDFEIIIDPLFYGEYVFDFATEQEIDYVLYKEDNNTWSIDTPEQLDFIAEMVNSGKYNFAGKTINLAKDIDLANDEFAPIGASGEFKGTFDGKGYTVKGLNVAMDDKDNSPAGLFGYVSGTLKNITVEGASVVGNTYVGGLVGHLTDGTVDNCTVKDSKVVNKAEKLDGTETFVTVATGGVVGYATTKAVIKAENKNTTVTANDNSDVIVGYQGEKEIAVAPEFGVEYDATNPVPAAGGDFVITVTGNVEWTVDAGELKSSIKDNVITVVVPENEDAVEKEYTVTVSTAADVVTKTYDVKFIQEAATVTGPVAVTVAEYLAAAEDDTMYQLTGVITRVANTTYGNFDLTDETGTVYIYGLCSPEGAQKYWAESGAKLGDTITIKTVRSSYNNAPQGKDARFVELVPFVETPSEWGIVGDLTSWGSSADITMFNTWKAKDLYVAYNVEIASGAFKIRANNEWNDAKNYGLAVAGKIYADKYYALTKGAGSQNATPMAYGTYDVYFDLANERVALVTPGKEYADAGAGGDPVVVIEGLTEHTWGLIGNFAASSNWTTEVAMEVVGDWAVAKNVTLDNGNEFKFRADGGWTLSYGSACDVNVGETYTTYNNGGNMKFVGEAGAYNIYFSLVDAKFYMEKYSAEKKATFEVSTYNFENQTALTSYTVGDITFAFDGGGNNNSPKYYTSGTAVRCYPKNTITVSGKKIKKVEVVAPDGYTNAIDLYDGSTKLDNFVWEGSSEEVVLTFDPNKTSGQSRFVKINVTYE